VVEKEKQNGLIL